MSEQHECSHAYCADKRTTLIDGLPFCEAHGEAWMKIGKKDPDEVAKLNIMVDDLCRQVADRNKLVTVLYVVVLILTAGLVMK